MRPWTIKATRRSRQRLMDMAHTAGMSVGEYLDRVITHPLVPVEATGEHEHEFAVSRTLAFDTCIHCPERRWH